MMTDLMVTVPQDTPESSAAVSCIRRVYDLYHVSKMGYTHIGAFACYGASLRRFMGYQVTGYYAPTFAMEISQQFMHFIDTCQRGGIGVILDWVPGGFCRDAHGLARFDGEKLYERKNIPISNICLIYDQRRSSEASWISNLLWWLPPCGWNSAWMALLSMLYLNFGIGRSCT